MFTEIEIRQVRSGDELQVYEINQAAFGGEVEPKLVELLRKSDAFIPELSLVATLHNNIVGHILSSKIKIRDKQGNEYQSLALAPMAVRPEIQNKGIGSSLVRTGLSIAKERGHTSVIVVGHANYYPKFGFQPADRWNIKAPFEVEATAFMAIELVKDGLKNVTGTVEYAKEFDMV